jgi:lipid II:glycine glycyltransferase (peptidoglycan interpeptide bridge formation enzyme)
VNYLLQWEAIKEAKKRNMQTYNFWGISPNENPNHRFSGVTKFKIGFGGSRVDYLHAHDLPISSWYWAVYLLESLRKSSRRL